MVLDGGQIFPLVEINARVSFGLALIGLSRTLGRSIEQGFVGFIDFSNPTLISFEAFFQHFVRVGLSVTHENSSGIVPLGSGTWTTNRSGRGRLYFAAIADSRNNQNELAVALGKTMTSAGLKIY